MVKGTRPWSMDVDCDDREDILSDILRMDMRWYEPEYHDILDRGYMDIEFDGEEHTLKIESLSQLLSEHPEEEVQERLNRFRAGGATAFGLKMRYDAIPGERSGLYRTFLLTTFSGDIAGYIMLGLGNIHVPVGNGMSRSALRMLNLDDGHGSVPAYVLAQASWSMDWPSKLLSVLMGLAYSSFVEASSIVGDNLVMMECDEEQAKGFLLGGFRTVYDGGGVVRLLAKF